MMASSTFAIPSVEAKRPYYDNANEYIVGKSVNDG